MSTFVLPKLDYSLDGLQPQISKETLEYHYGKHHQTYVTNLNNLVEGKPEAKKTLDELLLETSGPLFNNVAQHWNHSFYWKCLAPKAGGIPSGAIAEAIKKDFGSFDEFKAKFTDASIKLFGSGWAWLARQNDGKLAIVQTKDAENPLRSGLTPILTCDVWEHAYYIDYRNARAKYVEAFWGLVNWEFVQACLESKSKTLFSL